MKKLLFPLCLAALGALPCPARPLTAEDVQRLPRLGECRISPDARWLAVTLSVVDVKKNQTSGELRIYPAEVSSLDRPTARFAKASRPRWSPDGKHLMFSVASQIFVCPVCPTLTWKAQAVAHNFKDGANAPVWAPDNRHIGFSAPAPAKPGLGDSGRLYDDLLLRRWNRYYDGRRLHLFVTEVGAQRPPRDVTPGEWDAYPTMGTFSSGDNFCFSPDSRALLLAAPPVRGQAGNTNYDVYRLELASGAKTNLTAANPASDMGPRLSPDLKKLYIVSQSRPGYESDFSQLRSCPIDPSGRPSGEWRVETTLGKTGLGEFLHTDGGCYFSRNENATSHLYWQDERGAESPIAAPAGSLRGLSCDRGGTHWTGMVSSLSHPPQLVLGDRSSGKTRILALQPFDPSVRLGQVESVEVPVEASAVPMQMWIIKPPDFTPEKRWPLAFLVHGGPQGGWSDDWSLRWNAQVWAAQGFVVAMPNPRGSSGRTRAFQEEVSRDWGGRPYRDLMRAADYLAALPYVDKDRMVAAGASYGGYMINWFAVHTGRFRALVTHCGVWNLESEFGTTDELWFPNWEMGGAPWGPDMPVDYAKFSPHRFAEKLGQFKTPHLVIHNDLDYRCPINQGLELFTALQTQGVESKFLNFPDECHWVLKPLNSLRWHREVFAFLKEHIR